MQTFGRNRWGGSWSCTRGNCGREVRELHPVVQIRVSSTQDSWVFQRSTQTSNNGGIIRSYVHVCFKNKAINHKHSLISFWGEELELDWHFKKGRKNSPAKWFKLFFRALSFHEEVASQTLEFTMALKLVKVNWWCLGSPSLFHTSVTETPQPPSIDPHAPTIPTIARSKLHDGVTRYLKSAEWNKHGCWISPLSVETHATTQSAQIYHS